MNTLRGFYLAACVVAACGSSGRTPPAFYYNVANEGGPPVIVFVNGMEIGRVDCYGSLDISNNSNVPPLPWTIEFRRPDGKVAGTDHVYDHQMPGVMFIREYDGFALEFHMPWRGDSGGPAPPTACVSWPPS